MKNSPMTTLLMLFAASGLAADLPSDEASTAFFKTYCLRCHDAQKQEWQFRLDTLPREFVDQATAQRWGEVVFRMNSGEMPPKDEPQPKADSILVADRNGKSSRSTRMRSPAARTIIRITRRAE